MGNYNWPFLLLKFLLLTDLSGNITQALAAQSFPLFLNYIQICEVKEISSTFRENLNDLSTSRCEESS